MTRVNYTRKIPIDKSELSVNYDLSIIADELDIEILSIDEHTATDYGLSIDHMNYIYRWINSHHDIIDVANDINDLKQQEWESYDNNENH